jgi:hypothetical protein
MVIHTLTSRFCGGIRELDFISQQHVTMQTLHAIHNHIFPLDAPTHKITPTSPNRERLHMFQETSVGQSRPDVTGRCAALAAAKYSS